MVTFPTGGVQGCNIESVSPEMEYGGHVSVRFSIPFTVNFASDAVGSTHSTEIPFGEKSCGQISKPSSSSCDFGLISPASRTNNFGEVAGASSGIAPQSKEPIRLTSLQVIFTIPGGGFHLAATAAISPLIVYGDCLSLLPGTPLTLKFPKASKSVTHSMDIPLDEKVVGHMVKLSCNNCFFGELVPAS